MTVNRDPEHPIIVRPHEFNIVGFYFHVEPENPLKSYIDMTLKKGSIVRRLRFYGPRDLAIEKGFPMPTRGLEILDVSARQMSDINVRVTDFEASPGSVTFWAKNVVDLDEMQNEL